MPSAAAIVRVVSYGDPATRTRILDVTWRLIEDGDDATMAAVAKAAGVSRQAVYLHFGDRGGLLLALVEHMDRSLGIEELVPWVFGAPTGVEALERLVTVLARLHERIIGVARVFDAARLTDPDVAAAWDDRMAGRREAHRRVFQRIADEDRLADGWDVATAARLAYVLTLPRVWDELVVRGDWDSERYVEHLTALLRDGFVRQ